MDTARELTRRLAALLRDEHAALADFVAALAAFDEQRLWLELGYSSLFMFLHRELGLSKGAAQYRKTAAELARRVPEILEPLRAGQLCLSVVVELARVLTPENRGEVLPRFFRLSRQEAMEVVAELSPRPAPPLRQVTTAVPAGAPAHVPAAAGFDLAGRPADLLDANSRLATGGTLPQPAREATRIEPVTAELRRVHLTVSRRLLDKLAAARAALSHSRPGASDDEILEAGLDLVLAAQEKRKGITAKPRKEPPPSSSNAIPAHVKRGVWQRDGGRCQWPTSDGGICGSTVRVQFAHRIPRARGGPATVDNLRLCCATHNQHEARLDFGDAHQDRYTRAQRASPGGGARDEGPR